MRINEFTEEQILDLAKKTYETGTATFEIIPTKCVLLVVDMQDEFVKPNWSPYWVPEATRQIPKIKRLINHCRGKEIPVIFTLYSKTHQYMDRPKASHFMPYKLMDLDFDQSFLFVEGHVWHELKPEKDDIIIHKSSYGAFYDTPLETILKNLGKDTVIISGTLTNYCCSMTARQAYERSFKVVFGSDVTSAHFTDLQEAELKILRRGFAKVMSLEDIIATL